jgi:osmotically-inducible protein OsmY
MRLTMLAAIVAVVTSLEIAAAVTGDIAQFSAEKPDDVQLQTAIAQAMQTSPLTANSLIVVHVNHGEVTLEGAAVNPLARREATRLAETVLGVTGIRNRLSVLNTQTAELPSEK